MKHILILVLAGASVTASAQTISRSSVAEAAQQLDDVMEITDTVNLRNRIAAAQQLAAASSDMVTRLRLGILYHEAALNFTLLAKTGDKGLAAKSYSLLDSLAQKADPANAFLPIIVSYRASALALIAGETGSLKQLGMAFDLFEIAVKQYAPVSALPEFLRGSVAENLPKWMFRKHRFARIDMNQLIQKYEADSSYATPKLMSFVYWAWANQHQKAKYRTEALRCLDKAIALDKTGKAGKQRAEALKAKLLGK